MCSSPVVYTPKYVEEMIPFLAKNYMRSSSASRLVRARSASTVTLVAASHTRRRVRPCRPFRAQIAADTGQLDAADASPASVGTASPGPHESPFRSRAQSIRRIFSPNKLP